jgi:hypothetical protein
MMYASDSNTDVTRFLESRLVGVVAAEDTHAPHRLRPQSLPPRPSRFGATDAFRTLVGRN